MLSGPYALDTLNFWNGMMFGYGLSLLTLLVIIAMLNRLRPKGGARP